MRPLTKEAFEAVKSKFNEEQLQVVQKLIRDNDTISRRQFRAAALVTPLLGAFGLVSVLYGFEKLIDQTALGNQPIALLMVGVLVLVLTGAYYQKLS